MKTCSKCKQRKTLDQFYSDVSMKDGLNGWCKSCCSARAAKYYLSNKKTILAKNSGWHYGNKERHSKLNDNWWSRHPEKKAIKDKRFNKNHPEHDLTHQENRRKRKLNAAGDGVTSEQWRDVLDEYHHCCGYCGKKGKLTLDHIVPLAKGGAHDISNIVPACRSCNSRKQDTSLLLFLWKTFVRVMA